MAVPSPAKAALRQELKARRGAFVSGIDVEAVSRVIADQVLEHGNCGPVVALYQALRGEVDTTHLIDRLTGAGHRIALPLVEGETMRFLAWEPGEPLVEGPFGLHQPADDAPEVAPDTVITPLLGFDRACNRIGYGAGHYDRAFARFPAARRIALAWSLQQCDAIPVDAWDVPLHAVATEHEWITP